MKLRRRYDARTPSFDSERRVIETIDQ